MRTITRTNAVLYLLCAAALSVPIVASGQIVDGDLTYWRYEDTAQLSEVYGVAMFADGSVAAVGRDVFVQEEGNWSFVGTGKASPDNVAQGPDGKVWIRNAFYGFSGYWTMDGFHGDQFVAGQAVDGWLLDIVAWRANHYLIFGALVNIGAWVYSYCDPSCEDMSCVAWLASPGTGQYGEHSLFGCTVSGDYLALISTGPPRIIHIPDWGIWDFPDCGWGEFWGAYAGRNSYFWIQHYEGSAYQPNGLVRVDALNRTSEYVSWLDGLPMISLLVDWRGLWVLVGDWGWPYDVTLVAVGFWSFQGREPEAACVLPGDAGTREPEAGGLGGGMPLMTVTNPGELWFATDKAVCRWSPDPGLIPMPYEARVEARAKGGGEVEVEIEFDNLRIIRNDATLHLKIECLGVDEEEPVWLSASYQVYHEFQPQETFRYSLAYVPSVLPSMDRIRYSVFTTYIDVNAPPSDEEIITSNIAAAEVTLD